RNVLRDAESRAGNEGRVARIVGGAGAAVGAAVTPGVPSGCPVRVTVAAACVSCVARRRDEQRYARSPKAATSSVPARLHGYLESQDAKGIATLAIPRRPKIQRLARSPNAEKTSLRMRRRLDVMRSSWFGWKSH